MCDYEFVFEKDFKTIMGKSRDNRVGQSVSNLFKAVRGKE